jgi:ATP-dependent phosphofructokinase / diphosphate-dependent phosphofructokinase
LGIENVRGILPRGGTILGAANRGNPYARKVIRDGKEVTVDVSTRSSKVSKRLKTDALLVLGGDGTLHIAHELYKKGAPVIGVPKTIDNDIGGTEVTFGFDTAVTTATEAIDKLHTTAEAHHRVMVLELMGRNAGFIALHAGVSGGTDVILIPEIPFKFESVVAKVRQRVERGMHFSIIAVSEGAKPLTATRSFRVEGMRSMFPRLGGIGQMVGEYIEKAGLRDARDGAGTPPARRHTHSLRPLACHPLRRGGGPPGTQGKFDRMVALHAGDIVDVSLEEALAVPKRVDVHGDAVHHRPRHEHFVWG